ncbi:putative armadillo-like helical, importin beta family [Helianthus annuus]|nr:putative armadillo-like helical, importin beta family [Helianthus annuus]
MISCIPFLFGFEKKEVILRRGNESCKRITLTVSYNKKRSKRKRVTTFVGNQFLHEAQERLYGSYLIHINVEKKAHAASAVLNFSKNCNPDIFTLYLDGIMSKLLVLLQNLEW